MEFMSHKDIGRIFPHGERILSAKQDGYRRLFIHSGTVRFGNVVACSDKENRFFRLLIFGTNICAMRST